jgi:two-component system CheB/CheR fusion protein
MPKSRPPPAKTARPQSKQRPVLTQGPPYRSVNFPVVGIGASAGGLEACRKLVEKLPAGNGMAFILIQHLDPTHESLMVDLLVGHTSMTVRQAADGMWVEPNHLYVIPPATYLSLANGALRLSQPQARHGARLPIDFLLHSLAKECGSRAVCVILSGTGADGSLGIKAVKDKGGLVIAQDPEEAPYDGMPRNAITTGAVDWVLPIAKIPEAIIKYAQWKDSVEVDGESIREDASPDGLAEIIDLLRRKTAHDFTLYKKGTLRRRIERRMALVSIRANEMDRYLKILQSDAAELDLLANDLLINVTSFFRDPKVFELLANEIVPDLLGKLAADQPLRIWIAGCSTGEEAYSLAMVFNEQVAAANRQIKLQIFASDVDADAIAIARDGLYPKSIAADVSPARLARFFFKDDRGYRVSPALRTMVIFTVQDLLVDPPFSRLDMISCRNLLIYLSAEAQEKIISVFHFALRENGLLLLGSAETVSSLGAPFETIYKQERLYRRTGLSGPGDVSFPIGTTDGARLSLRTGLAAAPSRQVGLADLCRRLVMESYAPAAVLINRKRECLFSLGPIDHYLRVAPGHPIHDLLAMARDGLRTKLRSVIHQAFQRNAPIVVPGGRMNRDGKARGFSIALHPVLHEGEDLLLLCFVDNPIDEQKPGRKTAPKDLPHVAELEQELAVTQMELQSAIRNLEISGEEQRAINEEALSVNEEYQSANEELLTSKEELQSLNEELTALNHQLQETLEMQRATSDDLENVLYSTDVATLFLDTNLKIRFFTPATKALFNIIPTDIGRPLADLHSLSVDRSLSSDARTVLSNLAPLDREIETPGGIWFTRRIMPYRTHDDKVEGVVITFANITDLKKIARALEESKQQAELANAAKSRFLAVASHDLRQPLQTLSLLQGLLAKVVKGEAAEKLVVRIEETLGVISGMLNTLLDINEIEAGTVRPEVVSFPVKDLLNRLSDEFSHHAQAQKLDLRMVPCGLSVNSDPRMLEQMVRNLLSNALKFTKAGKVLFGCRRHKGTLSIEIWDTGIGISPDELEAIFEEYHQVEGIARERGRGLGLGLSIVKRLGDLLGHQVRVRSHPGKGSVFTIEIALPPIIAVPEFSGHRKKADDIVIGQAQSRGTILAIEDDPEVRELLQVLLDAEGHHATTAPDGISALNLVAQGTIVPDLILADYNLPNGMNGLQVIAKLRKVLDRPIPGVILTGDISTETLRNIEMQNCIKLNKPVKLRELTLTIQRLLQTPQAVPHPQAPKPSKAVVNPGGPVVIIIDDDIGTREGIRSVLEDVGQAVEDYASSEIFLETYRPGREACLLIDATMPGMNGFELLQHLTDSGYRTPAIVITGYGDVSMAVKAMKAGASDFIEKPISGSELIASIERAFEQSRDSRNLRKKRDDAVSHIAGLTSRQRQIMDMVLAGHPNKNIAADLGISQRTVENHRASIMKTTGAKSLPALARLALAAMVSDG